MQGKQTKKSGKINHDWIIALHQHKQNLNFIPLHKTGPDE
jgi:hypothetical protein